MEKHKNRVLRVVSIGLLVAGCASTGVVPMDRDSYMIAKKDGSPGLGVSFSNKAEVYREAGDFCRTKGMEVETLNVVVTAAAPARLGSTELHFKCVPAGGTAQPLIRESDRIIEIRNRWCTIPGEPRRVADTVDQIAFRLVRAGRGTGGGCGLSDDELIRDYLLPARAFVTAGSGKVETASTSAAVFSRTDGLKKALESGVNNALPPVQGAWLHLN